MSKTLANRKNRSKVAFCNLKNISKEGVKDTICSAIEIADCKEIISAKKIFIKVNLLSQEVVPGQCTSPWVFEGVLDYLSKNRNAKIYFGDCNVASASQVEKAVINWGLKDIGNRYNATFVNLTKEEQKIVNMGPVLGNMKVPGLLLKMDAMITLPVVKTHCITPFTGALKNQWGLLPRARFQFHDVVHEAIAEINCYFNKIVLGVADLTIGMEGPGPRVGFPKICNVIMASSDLVALDSLIAKFMGINPSTVDFLKHSEKLGIGKTTYKIVGDPFSSNPFKPGVGKDYVIYKWRDRFKKIPILNSVIFTVPFYRMLGYIATKYNLWVWYRKTGKRLAQDICQHTEYGKEFETLIKS